MKNFRCYQLALALYRETQKLNVKGELKDQLNRAAMSIVLNLAEGSAKQGKERLRFFRTAMGSLRETQACLDIANAMALKPDADHLAASLYRLLQNPGRTPGG